MQRRSRAERALRQMFVVQRHVTLDRGLQILARAEACGCQNIADAAIEAFDHAIGLRVPRLDQTMRDAQRRTGAVEGVLSRRRLALGGESIGELSAVVGQQRCDLHRRGSVQPPRRLIGFRGARPDRYSDHRLQVVQRKVRVNIGAMVLMMAAVTK